MFGSVKQSSHDEAHMATTVANSYVSHILTSKLRAVHGDWFTIHSKERKNNMGVKKNKTTTFLLPKLILFKLVIKHYWKCC